MKTFKQFYEEIIAGNVPVVSIEKNQVDLDDEETVNEVNRNLSLVLSKDFANATEGLNAARKILSMYGIELGDVNLKNDRKGKLTIPISQYKSSGESTIRITPPFFEKDARHEFTFIYELKDGKYDVHAEIAPV